jgi:hypothetical protein
VPTLFIWGEADDTVGRIAAEGTAEFIDESPDGPMIETREIETAPGLVFDCSVSGDASSP